MRNFDEICFWQQEPPNFRAHAIMHLIMILIRWLVGFFSGVGAIARNTWPYALREAGNTGFHRDASGVYFSGRGMNVKLILADLKFGGLSGPSPAFAFISPHRRAPCSGNPYQPENSVVETALNSSRFPPPRTQVWD
jgi:hypothetical protein